MDYYKFHCPVCEKTFDKDSDIVVCPQCGAPHHRECYELEMKCHYADKHKDNFDFRTEATAVHTEKAHTEEKLRCPFCNTENDKDSKFCSQCGSPIDIVGYDRHNEESQGENTNGNNGNPQYTTFAFDPMGGLKAEDEIGEGVTVGECAKFVKNNTPFYSRLFHQIHKSGRSRFSFVGFFFSGGWMLYRKMYKWGALVTALLAVFLISQFYVTTFYSDLITTLTEISQSRFAFYQTEAPMTMEQFVAGLDLEDIIVLTVYYITGMGQFILRLICGLCGNKWYRQHCINKISKIKAEADSKETADTQLQTKGGVNNGIAISLIITYFALSFIPNFF